jgi:hypothetical protein
MYVCYIFSETIMGQDQEFSMKDTVKSHFEEQCIQCKYIYTVGMDDFIGIRRN